MAISRLCSIPSCCKKHYGNGFCLAHYTRHRRYGDPLKGGEEIKAPPPTYCTVPGCGRKARGHGLCGAHYMRQRRTGDPTGSNRSEAELLTWIRDHVDYSGDGCLTWPFNTHPNGSGATYIEGKKCKSTRIMCELAHGPSPSPDHEAAHNCGKGHEWCIHPQHLRWDTHHENQLDRIEHGTANRGETNGQAKLTADDVRAIRAMQGSATQQDIADRFEVSRRTISDIHRGRRWSWLD